MKHETRKGMIKNTQKKPRPISKRMTNAIIIKCEAHAEPNRKNIVYQHFINTFTLKPHHADRI